MALAADCMPYFPPRHIQQMESDLAMLAYVWDDCSDRPQPWGWSKAAKSYFLQHGVDSLLLPTDAELDRWRGFSSREFAADYIRLFLQQYHDMPELVGQDMRFVSLDKIDDVIGEMKRHSQCCVVKSPWSSSGRGIVVVRQWDDDVCNRIKSIAKKQGGVLVDIYYEKMLDFALEFKVEEGQVTFLGYSLFSSSLEGKYGYNLVASQEEITNEIDSLVGCSLESLRDAHLALLQKQIGDKYRGFLGIDMMAVKIDNVIAIHPCVEINMRLNMGILALMLWKKIDDRRFFSALKERLLGSTPATKDYVLRCLDRFECLRECMRSSTRVPLTPIRDVGFHALVEGSRLLISCN
jgi:hypothetical protein